MSPAARKPHDPSTPAEWQEAVNAAYFFLSLDSARQYGLLTGGPPVDIERCEEILTLGAARGVLPKEISR